MCKNLMIFMLVGRFDFSIKHSITQYVEMIAIFLMETRLKQAEGLSYFFDVTSVALSNSN